MIQLLLYPEGVCSGVVRSEMNPEGVGLNSARRQGPHEASDQDKKRPISLCQPLFGRAAAGQLAHEEWKVERERGGELPFGEVGFAAQGGSSQAALVEDVGEAALDELASFAQQGFSAGALYGSACFVKDLLDDGALVFLAEFARVGIADDGADAFVLQATGLLDAKVAFVCGEALQYLLLFGVVANAGEGGAGGEAFDVLPVWFLGVAADEFKGGLIDCPRRDGCG
jgi:hypothetical protein